MPWYKLPHTDKRMWFDRERPDLKPAAALKSKKPAAAPKSKKLDEAPKQTSDGEAKAD